MTVNTSLLNGYEAFKPRIMFCYNVLFFSPEVTMSESMLSAISPVDGRYAPKTQQLSKYASEFALIRYRLIVEINWLKILADCNDINELPQLSDDALHFLDKIIDSFDIAGAMRVKEIESTTNHDVKAVEYYLKEQLSQNPELKQHCEFIHFACTSEDINNLAYGLMIKDCIEKVVQPKISEILQQLKNFSHEYAEVAMLARTHGQPASPTTVGKEFANVHYRLQTQLEALLQLPNTGKLNGATGNFNAHSVAYPEVDWQSLSKNMIKQLELDYHPYTTQIEPHDNLAAIFHCLCRANNIVIDFCRDIWGYISLNYFKQKLVKGEIGSSTMPHKVNPIDFENAEGNLGIANALMEHLAGKLPISRWQRDLTDSTVLRNIGVCIGHSLLAFESLLKGLNKLELNQAAIAEDLENNWEILGEALQTVMRRYNIEQPYEKLKALTRGKKVNAEILQQFIADLALPDEVKQSLSSLTPATYIGIANKLAKEA